MNPKQIVYRYEGDPATDDPVEDLDGRIPVPQKAQVITRKEHSWRVVQVNIEHIPPAIPVYRVFLTKAS
jgi:hypothetical protein